MRIVKIINLINQSIVLLLLVGLNILSVSNFAQNKLFIKKSDGETIITALSNIEKIYFYNCGTAIVTYGSKDYNTVASGDLCWLKENLDIGAFITKSTEQSNNGGSNFIEKYCYNDNESNCETYGGLYMWDEAMNYSTTEGSQGICPDGWRIPTLAELETLKSEVNDDGNALKAIGQGSGDGAGTNTSGFSALFAGLVSYLAHGKTWFSLGTESHIWSSTLNSSFSYRMKLDAYSATITNSYDQRGMGFSVRCIFDPEAQ